MPHATLPSPGLQALILCGPGVSLNTFTSNPRDLPKALLPVANRPMIWYPLDWCHRMGVADITLITPPDSAAPLEAALATHPALTGLPSPKPDIVAPDALELTTGTGGLLRLPEVQACITRDFLVLPCDLVAELDGSRLLQQWMTLNPLPRSARKGALAVFYPTYGLEGISGRTDETDFLATVPLRAPPAPSPPGSLRPHIEEVVMAMPTDSLNDRLEADQGFLRLRQSLMAKHGRVKLRTKHRDAHVYVFPRWVKDWVARQDRLDSIGEDVLGWWAKAGWQAGLAAKLDLDVVLAENKPRIDGAMGVPEDEDLDPASLSSTKTSLRPSPSRTAFASRVGSNTDSPASPPSVTVIPPLLAYVAPASAPSAPQPLIRRTDTSAQLASVSLYLARQPASHSLAHEHKVHPTAHIGAQTRVSLEDSLVGENATVGTRCTIKECVVGANCEIGNSVRLSKCVLMEGVVVGDGVVMTGCVVGRRARVEGWKASVPVVDGEGAAEGMKKAKRKKDAASEDEEGRTKLTDCEVAPNFIVEAGTEVKGEKLMAFDADEVDGLDDEDGGEGEMHDET